MRIKNILLLCVVFLAGMSACREDDLVWYSEEKDGLHFWKDDAEGAPAELEIIRNFAMMSDEDGHFYGDSLLEIRIDKVPMALQGFPSPDERPYKLKAVLVEGQDSSRVAEVRFDDYYSLAPNALMDTIGFTLLRPKTDKGDLARGTFVVGIAVETEGNEAFFTEGTEEQAVLRIEVQDIYEKPEFWDDRLEWLGEFSEEKYAFMVTLSNTLFTKESQQYQQTDVFNRELREALAGFNAAHPDSEKPFDFPPTSKTVWWDANAKYLGEYTQEKYDFIMEYINNNWKDEGFREGARLEYLNVLMRKEMQYNPDLKFDFPLPTGPSTWWKEDILGGFSVEKSDFVVEKLYGQLDRIGEREISDNTWTWGGSFLRYELEDVKSMGQPYTFDFPKVEKAPEWWGEQHDKLFGEWSMNKEDVIVREVIEITRENSARYDIAPLVNFDVTFMEMNMKRIRDKVDYYNAWINPGNPIELPAEDPNKEPSWWKNNKDFLGDFSKEKSEFIQQVIQALIGDPWGMGPFSDFNSCDFKTVWNPVLRFELGAYNKANPDKKYDFTFPEVDEEWDIWAKTPYLGEYSETKKVFVLWHLHVYEMSIVNGGFLDPYALGSYPGEWVTNSSALMEAYSKEYENFMAKYPDAEPFEFQPYTQQ